MMENELNEITDNEFSESEALIEEAENTGDDNIQDISESDASEKGEPKYFKAFETKEQYQNNIDKIFNSRFKDYKETKSKYEDIIDNLKKYFDTEDDSVALDLFGKHMNEQIAEKKGISVDEYKKYSIIEKKADKYDALIEKQLSAINELREQENRNAQLRSRLFNEAAIISKEDKEFDLNHLYNNDKEFKNDLESTGSVYLAYTKLKSRKQKNIKFNESGSSNLTSGHISASAADLSDLDFENYINKIQGEY